MQHPFRQHSFRRMFHPGLLLAALTLLALAPTVAAQDLIHELASPNEEEFGRFGSVAEVPDADGDGRGDLLVGAYNETPGLSPSSAGRAYLFSGATGALLFELASPNPEAGGRFGGSVAGVPDVDGDGRADLLVGAYHEDPGTSPSNAGRAYLFSGTGIPTQTQLIGAPEKGDAFGAALATGDFNGDGRDDLAVGSPGEDLGSIQDAGVVNVIYGTPGSAASGGGLTAAGNQDWNQGSPGVIGASEAGDQFGAALAAGDFDCDGFDDLAVGIPGETFGTGGTAVTDAGSMNVIYGSASGLDGAGSQRWNQDSPGVGADPQTGDGFGSALASGDFNADGCDDLAVGVPGEDLGGNTILDAGFAMVFYGRTTGLTSTGIDYLSQESTQPDTPEAGDRVGFALAAGDFDGDGIDDLAVGAPGEDVGSITDAGAATVFYGTTATGLRPSTYQLWTEGPLLGDTGENDQFGYALTAGDFDGDGFDDLAVGMPFEDNGSTRINVGSVKAIYGSASGLTAVGNQQWFQDTPGIAGGGESFDQFGFSVAAGDFDGDGESDLAIGVFGEDNGATPNTGAANGLFGTPGGLATPRNKQGYQSTNGIRDVSEQGDGFGFAVATGDFNGDGRDDVAIGAPGEGINGADEAGAVNVLYGSGGAGFTLAGDDFWHQGSAGRSAPDAGTTATTWVADGAPEPGAPYAAGALATEDDGTTDPPAASSTASLPATTALGDAFPNPLTDRATVGFDVAEATEVRLAVYDVLGRTVAVLAEGTVEAGRHEAVFDAANLPSGTYLVRLEVADPGTGAGSTVETQRITLVR